MAAGPKKRLRVVTAADTPAPVKTLTGAVEGGVYLEILRAQRREIATTLPDEKGPAKAALHRQLSLISKEIETLELADVDGEGSVVADTDDEAFDGTNY